MEETNNCGIYKIVNIINSNCYVGQSYRLKQRKSEHFRRLRNNKHVNKHLQNSYNKWGEYYFEFVILCFCKPEDLTENEEYWNKKLKPVFNKRECTDSNRGMHLSEEHKRKISEANTGKMHSEESKRKLSLSKQNISDVTREKLRISSTGRFYSEETRKKMSLSKKGKPGRRHTEEENENLSKARMGNLNPMYGKKLPLERVEALRKINKEKIVSEETKRKHSESAKNRPPISEETREKMSKSQKNRLPFSEETKKRMSESGKNRRKKDN